jgi:nicotinate phosphoribosyltransferase
MAHSFVQIHDDEAAAFEDFARARPDGVVLLIDTFDTEAGARKVVELAPKLKKDGIGIRGVRIDSGDLIVMSRKVRDILDAGGLKDVIILVSGGVDEDFIAKVVAAGAPIDGFGVGASLDASSDAPVLDCAYKIQEYRGKPRRKLSEGKVTWPGRKQVWREVKSGRMSGDIVSVETDRQPGDPLVVQVMKGGKRIKPAETLATIRARAASELSRLPNKLQKLEPASYPVAIADALEELGRQAMTR